MCQLCYGCLSNLKIVFILYLCFLMVSYLFIFFQGKLHSCNVGVFSHSVMISSLQKKLISKTVITLKTYFKRPYYYGTIYHKYRFKMFHEYCVRRLLSHQHSFTRRKCFPRLFLNNSFMFHCCLCFEITRQTHDRFSKNVETIKVKA